MLRRKQNRKALLGCELVQRKKFTIICVNIFYMINCGINKVYDCKQKKDGESIMKVFFDTEFTRLHKDTTLISIGLIAENGKEFYAELTDFDESQCDKWIEENVLKNLILSGNDEFANRLGEKEVTTVVLGNKRDVMTELSGWFSQFDSVQLVSDVCHYDMVLLIDLFGGAFDLPENVSAVCHDINQDIARHYRISEREAFEKSREGIIKDLCGEEIDGDKHDALYDAEVIKAIYEEIN